MWSGCFAHLIKSYQMKVYVEVSKNHNYSIEYVIRHKFDPEIKILLMYYNNLFRMEAAEVEKMKNETEKNKSNINEVNL